MPLFSNITYFLIQNNYILFFFTYEKGGIDNLAILLILSSRVRPLTDISIITFLSGLCEVCRHGEKHVEMTPHTETT